jgi:hypothetical protein
MGNADGIVRIGDWQPICKLWKVEAKTKGLDSVSAGQSGRGLPHYKTWRNSTAPLMAQVLFRMVGVFRGY